MYKGEALTQPPPIADWSAAVAEEEQQQQGYYTDSMVSGRRHRRGSQGNGRGARKSSLSGSYRDLGKQKLQVITEASLLTSFFEK